MSLHQCRKKNIVRHTTEKCFAVLASRTRLRLALEYPWLALQNITCDITFRSCNVNYYFLYLWWPKFISYFTIKSVFRDRRAGLPSLTKDILTANKNQQEILGSQEPCTSTSTSARINIAEVQM